MRNNNYIKLEESDYYIKVGIKNKEVISIDWSDFYINDRVNITKKEVIEFLNKAILFIGEE